MPNTNLLKTPCELVFLFEVPKEKRSELRTEVNKALYKWTHGVEAMTGPEFEEPALERVKVRVSGPLEKVARCHEALASNVSDSWSARRLVDDAGAALRSAAYPLIAEVEEKLRRFIDETLTDACGFEWWKELDTDAREVKSIEEVRSKHKSSPVHQQWLDFSQFNHLVWLLSANLPHKQGDEPVSARELAELLDESSSIDELKTALAKQMEPRNLWDDVFAAYFEEKSDWTAAKETLDEIIEIRHKVMHHRAITLRQFRKLEAGHKEILDLLAAARPPKEETKEEAKENAKDILVPLSGSLRRAAASEQMVSGSFSAAVSAYGFAKEAERIASMEQGAVKFGQMERDAIAGAEQYGEVIKQYEQQGPQIDAAIDYFRRNQSDIEMLHLAANELDKLPSDSGRTTRSKGKTKKENAKRDDSRENQDSDD